ncbi:Low temperature viability protein [Trema orientale]|uniref:Low temperature viability protein n=1 Tax=Trema orientale TaxID=63057 RepID=A0A2P5EZP5_TREOI|nr:Low temperature viability protein [Trema orientale]
MGKKKFIDKKKSATFQLLARDSSDPNFDDSPGSDRVFVRVDNNNYSVDTFFAGDNPENVDDSNSIFADAPDDYDAGEDHYRVFGNSSRSAAHALPEHVRKEILELGFPDDGYNYLAHLREIKNTGGGSAFYHNPKSKLDQLPRDVKAYDASRLKISEVNADPSEGYVYGVASETVGVRVQRAVDPEVAALLDESDASRFGSDVEDLEEDFVIQANLPKDNEDVSLDKRLELCEQFETKDVIDEDHTFGHQQIASDLSYKTGAGYHVTEETNDSAIEKTRVCRPLDEQFDILESQEYGTDDDEDYGYVAEEDESLAEKLKHALNDNGVVDFDLDENYRVPADLIQANEKLKSTELLDSARDVIQRCVEYAEMYENDDQHENVVIVEESSDESEVWDCETIVSTYSNLDNHPGKIEAPGLTRKKKLAEVVSGAMNATNHTISLKGREKLPVDFLPRGRKPTTEKVKGGDNLRTEQLKRKQHESKEEKKERKAAVKEERKEARRVKKEMKGLYKGEAQRAQRVAAISGPSSIHLM